MVPKHIMILAGETSGDLLAAELVSRLREQLIEREGEPESELQPLRTSLAPRFFGAGGPRMAAAGVDLELDLTEHAVVGLSDVLKRYFEFRRIFYRLLRLAIQRQPVAIIGVDFSGFNLRFARAVKRHVRAGRGSFNNWNPLCIQYVSPQVWASRPGRAAWMEQDVDLLLCTFPFEKDWYATRAPRLPVEFVGNPLLDRHADRAPAGQGTFDGALRSPKSPLVLLLPGSRAGEIRRHVPVMAEAARRLSARRAVRLRMVLPSAALLEAARGLAGGGTEFEYTVGGLSDELAQADLAIASTGTVTLECAYFGVPTVALYKTSWSTYEIGKRLIQVGFLAMPNLLAGRAIMPEFIQQAATPENLERAAGELLEDTAQRADAQRALARVIQSLGQRGASARAAAAIVRALGDRSPSYLLRAHLAG